MGGSTQSITANSEAAPRGALTDLAPPGGRIYRPGLDALRFFAFLGVFLHHTLNISKDSSSTQHPFVDKSLLLVHQCMGFGLCMFFFLSSYLITSLLQMEKTRTKTVDLPKFYLRRILRIWPLYFMFLALSAILGVWLQGFHIEIRRLLALFFLSGNWYYIAFGTGSLTIAFLWSISIEEQFYLLWPSINRGLSKRSLSIVCCGLCMLSLIITYHLASTRTQKLDLWLNSFVQSLFFAGGALLALRIGINQKPASLFRSAIGIGGGFITWLFAENIGHITVNYPPMSGMHTTTGFALICVGCALILWGFLHLPHYLLPRPLLYLGRISYGLYVFHGIVLLVFRTYINARIHTPGLNLLLNLSAVIILASLSYQFLEKPFLKLKSRFELVKTRAA